MLRAVIYADSRAELLEPPHIFLKDRIVVPSPEPSVALLSAGSKTLLSPEPSLALLSAGSKTLRSHMYFQMNAYHDFTREPLLPLHI
jgi:hypothetical protein